MESNSAPLLELIGDVLGLLDIGEFRTGLLDALPRAIPVDWISLNELGQGPESALVMIVPEFSPEDHETFARYAHQNPLIERFTATGDGRAYRFSDVVTSAQLHRLDLYREFYGPLGLEHQIAFTLPHLPTRLLGVALSRRDRDFSDAERDLLNAARPFLIQAYRNAIHCSALARELARRPSAVEPPSDLTHLLRRGLTPRECEVLAWVATGSSDVGVANQLGVSERTVQKHLQHCYRKLGVRQRTLAAALVWADSGPPG